MVLEQVSTARGYILTCAQVLRQFQETCWVWGPAIFKKKWLHSLFKKKKKADLKSMLPITVKFGWVIWMTSHWASSGSDPVQRFIGNLDDWSLLPDLVNSQRAHSVLLSKLLTKTSVTIGTSTDPLEVSLVTSCQLDFVLLITTLSAQQISQISTHYVLYLSKPYLTNLAIRKQ